MQFLGQILSGIHSWLSVKHASSKMLISFLWGCCKRL